MRRTPLCLLAVLAVAGCGGTTTRTVTVPRPLPVQPRCNPAPGRGVMGVCVPRSQTLGAPLATFSGRTLLPDVSEFQGCALHSEAIYRVYEAGTNQEDSRARCHAHELRRKHAWSAAYAFLRPSRNCDYEAARTVSIVNQLGGADVIVGDSEVGIRGGFTRCFLREVEHLGYPAVEYTCPGCGDEQVGRIWIASYPARPAGRWVAHQFSEAFECRGVFGDCSVDEGILSIRPAPSHHQIEAELAGHERVLGSYRPARGLRGQLVHLRQKLNGYGCARRRSRHERLGPVCRGWYAAGGRVSAHGRLEDAVIARLRRELGR